MTLACRIQPVDRCAIMLWRDLRRGLAVVTAGRKLSQSRPQCSLLMPSSHVHEMRASRSPRLDAEVGIAAEKLNDLRCRRVTSEIVNVRVVGKTGVWLWSPAKKLNKTTNMMLLNVNCRPIWWAYHNSPADFLLFCCLVVVVEYASSLLLILFCVFSWHRSSSDRSILYDIVLTSLCQAPFTGPDSTFSL